jgi:uncharacterized protein
MPHGTRTSSATKQRRSRSDHWRISPALPTGYNIVPVDRDIFARASNLCRMHPLRAYDAVQLACALQVHDDALAIDATPPTFVCADVTLAGVAVSEGLASDDPNAHP